MIAIVMTYFNRPQQLEKTLKTIDRSTVKDKLVVVVDDGDIKPLIPPVSYPIEILTTKNKRWVNPEPAYNTGIFHVLDRCEILMIQNAECYHAGDVIRYAKENITQENYISFGCFSLDQQTTSQEHNIHKLLNSTGATRDGQLAWYNHPIHRPVGYDFCMAVTKENMIRLNGFDERLSAGCGYGDDYLIYRVKLLGLKIEITETPFVVHQWHYNTPVPGNKPALIDMNRRLFEQLKKEKTVKAIRFYTYEQDMNTLI